MAAFEYRQAQGIRDAFARYCVRFLFLSQSGTILDDIIASKESPNRKKDRESLDRLRAFRSYWRGERG